MGFDIAELEQEDESLAELRDKAQTLWARIEQLQERRSELGKDLVDADAAERETLLKEQSSIDTELNSIPGQLEEITRRRVHRHIDLLHQHWYEKRAGMRNLAAKIDETRERLQVIQRQAVASDNPTPKQLQDGLDRNRKASDIASDIRESELKLSQLDVEQRALAIRIKNAYGIEIQQRPFWDRAANEAAASAKRKASEKVQVATEDRIVRSFV